jgi:hypothetical protein
LNLAQLKAALVESGIAEMDYFIEGIDTRDGGKGASTGELVLGFEDGEWVAYSWERGTRRRERRFGTEEELAAWAWEELEPPLPQEKGPR